MSIDELYREVILDHSDNPRNKGPLEPHNIMEHGHNPLCGDKIDLYLNIDDSGVVNGVSFEGSGCSISQASISMLTEVISGKPIQEVQDLIGDFKGMMLEDEPNPFEDDEDLEELGALEGVKNFPVRIKCALLGWTTLDEALKKFQGEQP